MNNFLKNFLQQDIRALPVQSPARIYVAAFGKHPGWNDHIDDLGLETRTLVIARQLLYVEGISSQIDAGAWEKLDPGSLYPSFDHLLLWQRPGEAIVGVIASSRDGKGRTRYPMVVCAHVVGLPLDRVIEEIKPAIEAAMVECRSVETAAAVREIIARTRQQLSDRLDREPARADDASASGSDAEAEPSEGQIRILYEIKSKLAAWAPGRVGAGGGAVRERGVHLRLPEFRDSVASVWSYWTTFLHSQLDVSAPMLFLSPRNAGWMDVIVGEPAAADFFVLKAGAKAVPLASEVPYKIDETFRTAACKIFGEVMKGSASVRTVFGDREVAERSAIAGRIAEGRAAFQRVNFKRAWPRLRERWGELGTGPRRAVIIAALILFGAGVIWCIWRMTASNGESARRETASMAVASQGTVVFPPWGKYCHAYYDWFGAFYAALQAPGRKQLWVRDPYLRTKVVVPIEQVRRRLEDLDPRKLAKVSGSLTSLAETVPGELADESVRSRVADAAMTAHQVGEDLLAWPVTAQLRQQREMLQTQGWAVVGELPAEIEALKLDGSLPAQVDVALESFQRVAEVAALARQISADADALTTTEDPVLTLVAKHALALARESKSLADLRKQQAAGQAEVSRLRAIAGDLNIDWLRFKREENALLTTTAFDSDLANRWQVATGKYRAVADSECPLLPGPWQSDLEQARVRLNQLKPFVKEGTLFAGLQSRLAELERDGREHFAHSFLRKDLPALHQGATNLSGRLSALTADLTRELSVRVDPAGWLQQQRAIIFAESPALDAEWRERRDALLQGEDENTLKARPERLADLQARMEQVEIFLRQLANLRDLPVTLPVDAAISEDLTAGLRKVVPPHREAAMADLLRAISWQDGLPRQTFEEFRATPAVSQVIAAYGRWQEELLRFGRDITRAAALLEQGYGWNEQIGSVLGPWSAKPVDPPELMVERLPAQVLKRAVALESIEAEGGREYLVQVARTEAHLAEALAAWRRLGKQTDWPRTAIELSAENDIACSLKIRIERDLKPSDRRSRLLQEIAAERVRRWKTAFASAPQTKAWDHIFALQDAFGVTADQLDSTGRFNSWLYRARQIDWTAFKPEELGAERGRELEVARPLAKGLSAATEFLDRLAAISLTEESIDFSQTGPGKVKWQLVKPSHPGWLAYEWNGHRLEFAPVDSVAPPVYLCTTEMPVGLFVDWIKEQKLRPDVEKSLRALLDEYTNIFNEKRWGPTSYIKSAGADFEVSKRWLNRLPADYYPSGGSPTPMSPVNYVSPSTAQLIAESLNCRLPKTQEWLAAESMAEKAGNPMQRANLRDRSWEKYWQKVMHDPRPENLRYWPDGDIFLPLTPEIPRDKSAALATDGDDGVLWLADVNSDDAVFHHLIGNVAEYVTDDAASCAIVGASALSPKELKAQTPYPVPPNDTRGFSDVGFRIAFSLGKLSPAQKLQALIAAQDYVGTAQ